MFIVRVRNHGDKGRPNPIRVIIVILLIIHIAAAMRRLHVVALLHLMLTVRVVHVRIFKENQPNYRMFMQNIILIL